MRTTKQIILTAALLSFATPLPFLASADEEATTTGRVPFEDNDSNNNNRNGIGNDSVRNLRGNNIIINNNNNRSNADIATTAASHPTAVTPRPSTQDINGRYLTRDISEKRSNNNNKKRQNKQNKKNANKNQASAAASAPSFRDEAIEMTPPAFRDNVIDTPPPTTSTSTLGEKYENDLEHKVRSSYELQQLSSSANGGNHVDYMYTYGAPSVAKGPAVSNPNNRCIPGIRIYTEDVEDVTCPWWKFWCTPGEQITNVDFASQINVKQGYPHPKMATLILREREGNSDGYTYKPCLNSENKNVYNHQWWPQSNLDSDMMPNSNNHHLDKHYERRLMNIPQDVRGPSLEYVSVAKCAYESSYSDIRKCLNRYDQVTSSQIGGVSVLGWELLAFMVHETDRGIGFLSDNDTVFVVKHDRQRYNDHSNSNYRRCIIGFQGSNGVDDLTNFAFGSNDETVFCGRSGVHTGVSNELSKITNNPEYGNAIVPALETCHEVTCVGHSLGGALCNAFTMCANQGLVNDDYNSLIWTKKV